MKLFRSKPSTRERVEARAAAHHKAYEIKLGDGSVVRRTLAPRPTQGPTPDAVNAFKALYDGVRKPDGSRYAALAPGQWVAFQRWVLSIYDQDGRGLRDALDQAVQFLNAVKGDVDIQAQSIIDLRAQVQALQEAPPARPFP